MPHSKQDLVDNSPCTIVTSTFQSTQTHRKEENEEAEEELAIPLSLWGNKKRKFVYSPPPEIERVSPTSVCDDPDSHGSNEEEEDEEDSSTCIMPTRISSHHTNQSNINSNNNNSNNNHQSVEQLVNVCTHEANDPSEDRYDFMLQLHLQSKRNSNCRGPASCAKLASYAKSYALSLFAVYDGHGGGACAQYAQEKLLRTCAKYIASSLDCEVVNLDLNDSESNDETENLPMHMLLPYPNAIPACDSTSDVNPVEGDDEVLVRRALQRAFEDFDREWIRRIENSPVQRGCVKNGLRNAGACAVVAAVLVPDDPADDARLFTAHCGDCRAALIRTNPNQIQDHNENLNESEWIKIDQEQWQWEYLTVDHSASNTEEQELVRQRCNYAPHAITHIVRSGVCRVAGSLAITRALGDAYLKVPELSFGVYKDHCPYITCQPTISSRAIPLSCTVEDDVLLCLASDGVLEKLDGSPLPPNSIENTDDEEISGTAITVKNASERIVDQALENVRRMKGMANIQALHNLKRGRTRRTKHDDMTCLTFPLKAFLF